MTHLKDRFCPGAVVEALADNGSQAAVKVADLLQEIMVVIQEVLQKICH